MSDQTVLVVVGFIVIYLLAGELVLDRKLRTAYLRPLTDKEMFLVVLTWWMWL